MPATPPSRKPHYFDVGDPDGPGLNPNRASTWLVDRFWDDAGAAPEWELNGMRLSLEREAHLPGKWARLRVLGAGSAGTLAIVPDSTGWLTLIAHVGEREVFRGYLEQPYEEYEVWPSGVAAEGESPGRIGKRRNWVELSAAAWPALQILAGPQGLLSIKAVET